MTGRGLLSMVLALIASAVAAADWPSQWHDLRRSRVTETALKLPLQRVWRYTCAQPPRPAWPPPPRLLNRLTFDYAAALTVADGMVCFGSSADDTIRALDAGTGRLRWRFTTGGPVRFAPQLHNGRVYAAADDGWVYCLRASDGSLQWRFQAAPKDDLYLGNQRLISRWPCRNGVLVEDEFVYTVAGIWPSEGIYVYCLSADSGEVVWVNDHSNWSGNKLQSRWHLTDPHMGEFSFNGPTPQGVLMASKDYLMVPLGNNSPASFRKRNGAMTQYAARSVGQGNMFIDYPFRYTFLSFRSGLGLFGAPVPDKLDPKPAAKRWPETALPQVSLRANRLAFQAHSADEVQAIVHQNQVFGRQGYGLVLAADKLVVGGDDVLRIEDAASGAAIWSATISGKARELAVADGCLFVSTDTGEISCFATAETAAPPAAPAPPAMQPAVAAQPLLLPLRDAGIDRGYALTLGDDSAELGLALAANSSLHVVVAVTQPSVAAQLRQRFLETTSWYGSRMHVVQLQSGSTQLPFAPYFANAVIVGESPTDVAPAEMLRVLRPAGGLALLPRSAGTLPPGYELVGDVGKRRIVRRRRLEGARDWDVNTSGDKLVRWPLRPIWFGGPASELVMNRGIGSHPPVAASGRYFVTGQDCLTAVDAYNGTVLWTRPIPSATPGALTIGALEFAIADGISSSTTAQWSTLKRWLDADADHVYLRLGEGYFRDQGEALIQLSARDGSQQAYYGPRAPGPIVVLTESRTFTLPIDAQHEGSLDLLTTETGITVNLRTKDPHITSADVWDLHFDFRPPAERCGLHGRATISLRVAPAIDGRAPVLSGDTLPGVTATGVAAPAATEVEVVIPWSAIAIVADSRPASFGFAADLTSFDGEPTVTAIAAATDAKGKPLYVRSKVVRRHLFGDDLSDSLAFAWATVVVADAADVDAISAALAGGGAIDARPSEWPWPDEGADRYIGNPGSIDATWQQTPRLHPLTGEPVPRLIRTGTGGCGNPAYSATTLFGKTDKLAMGIYDFADDGGLHFFPGISPNCGASMKAINMTAALGLLIFSEARSHCDCMIPLRTSLAFAPDQPRLHEDWGLFSDRDYDAPIRWAAINLAAIGDQRDADGMLWLSFPRPSGGKAYPVEPGTRRYVITEPPVSSALFVPLELERFPGIAPWQRINADSTPIGGTDRPWLYGSCMTGIRQAVLQLTPEGPIAAAAIAGEVVVDGQLTASEEPRLAGSDEQLTDWRRRRLKFTGTSVFVGYDDHGLYLAAHRPMIEDRLGKYHPWTAKQTERDAAVWLDDSFEVFLSDPSGTVVHLGLSAGGARYDALAAATEPESAEWNGDWTGAAVADPTGLVVELRVPWSMLAELGLARDALSFNCQANQQDLSTEIPIWPGVKDRIVREDDGIGDCLLSLGPQGRAHCSNFVPLLIDDRGRGWPERRFTVRLHFAEIAGADPGQRVFDVKLQGETVLQSFDAAAEGGGQLLAVMREFRGIEASDSLTLQFIPQRPLDGRTAPILSALEIRDEAFTPYGKGD